MLVCEHRVSYHETDKMGIVHHSNYIKWMEDSRIAFLDKLGCPFKSLEANGFFSPVVDVQCSYKSSVIFDDIVGIDVDVVKVSSARFMLKYSFFNLSQNNILCADGKSTHCFIDISGNVMNMSKSIPVLFQHLKSLENQI